MKDLEKSYDELFEALTLEPARVVAKTPPFQGFGPDPKLWGFYGPWNVPAKWNPLDHYDIEYRGKDDKLHRIFGPAYVSTLYNVEAWYKDGLRHREGGPAYTHKGTMVWFYEDKLHRLDGPAVVEGGGPKQYWIHGQRLSPKEYKKEIARRRRKGLVK
jgi:hypothetical protein